MNSFCIIGLGKFGTTLAISLEEEGKQVLVIDTDNDAINALSDYVTNAIVGDPTSEAVLKTAGVADYDCAIVCIASNVNDSTLITLMLKDLGVKKVIARAGSDHHRRVLEKIGADRVIFPERDMGEKLAKTLARKNAIEYIEFSEDYLIAEMVIPKKWVGKTLASLNVREKYGVTVIAIVDIATGKINVTPDPHTPLEDGTMLTVMGNRADVNKVTDLT